MKFFILILFGSESCISYSCIQVKRTERCKVVTVKGREPWTSQCTIDEISIGNLFRFRRHFRKQYFADAACDFHVYREALLGARMSIQIRGKDFMVFRVSDLETNNVLKARELHTIRNQILLRGKANSFVN